MQSLKAKLPNNTKGLSKIQIDRSCFETYKDVCSHLHVCPGIKIHFLFLH